MSHKNIPTHRKSLSIVALTGGLTLLAAAGAFAQPGWGDGQYGGSGRGPAPFSAMDADGDGTVSAAEHADFRAQRIAANSQAGRLLRNAGNAPAFTDLDADGDGRLTQLEMAQFRSQRMAQRAGQRGWPRGGPGSGRCGGPRYGGW
jgi:muconolactone delta-isomerase